MPVIPIVSALSGLHEATPTGGSSGACVSRPPGCVPGAHAAVSWCMPSGCQAAKTKLDYTRLAVTGAKHAAVPCGGSGRAGARAQAHPPPTQRGAHPPNSKVDTGGSSFSFGCFG